MKKARSKFPAGKPKFTPSQETRKWIAEKQAAQDDWYGTCRWCKEPQSGTLAALRAHKKVCPKRPEVADGPQATE